MMPEQAQTSNYECFQLEEIKTHATEMIEFGKLTSKSTQLTFFNLCNSDVSKEHDCHAVKSHGIIRCQNTRTTIWMHNSNIRLLFCLSFRNKQRNTKIIRRFKFRGILNRIKKNHTKMYSIRSKHRIIAFVAILHLIFLLSDLRVQLFVSVAHYCVLHR